MVNTYVRGSLIRVATYTGPIGSPTGGFRDDTGALADPDVVTLVYSFDGGVTTTTVTFPNAPIVKDAVGLYHADLDSSIAPTPPAECDYEWKGTGTIQAVGRNIFEIDADL